MKGVRNDAILREFADYLRIEKGLSELTVEAYLMDIRQFVETLKNTRRRLVNAKEHDVREFIQQLFERQASGKTVCRKLTSLRQLYFHLQVDRKIKYDPTIRMEFPQQWRTLPRSLTTQEVADILKASSNRVKEESK